MDAPSPCPAPETPPARCPHCRHLRTKKMFIPAQADEAFEEKELPGSDSFCWCNITMTEIGNDDRLVNVQECSNPARTCYSV